MAAAREQLHTLHRERSEAARRATEAKIAEANAALAEEEAEASDGSEDR